MNGLVDNFPGLFQHPYLPAIFSEGVGNTASHFFFLGIQHDVRAMDRSLLGDNLARFSLLLRLDVLGPNVDAFNHDLASFRNDGNYFAHFAAIASSNNLNRIPFADMNLVANRFLDVVAIREPPVPAIRS
jgi:hypothetical protein